MILEPGNTWIAVHPSDTSGEHWINEKQQPHIAYRPNAPRCLIRAGAGSRAAALLGLLRRGNAAWKRFGRAAGNAPRTANLVVITGYANSRPMKRQSGRGSARGRTSRPRANGRHARSQRSTPSPSTFPRRPDGRTAGSGAVYRPVTRRCGQRGAEPPADRADARGRRIRVSRSTAATTQRGIWRCLRTKSPRAWGRSATHAPTSPNIALEWGGLYVSAGDPAEPAARVSLFVADSRGCASRADYSGYAAVPYLLHGQDRLRHRRGTRSSSRRSTIAQANYIFSAADRKRLRASPLSSGVSV